MNCTRALCPWLLRAAFAAAVALPAHAGGPLTIVNGQPVVYANGGANLTLNLDQGTLGSRSNAQAAALVQNAIGLWNGVSTSTMRLAIGPQLATDYTSANYGSVLGNYTDGLNPVIYDSDGSITDLLFGAGAKNSVLGFAGSAYSTTGPSAGRYREGRAVLNGWIPISDATWTVVLAHEFGHFFGLDHAQLDGAQGLQANNYVLMYPIAYRTLPSLHEDDVAAVSALYPAAGIGTAYGQLTGTFTTAGGTPIRGANVWAREISTLKVYSIVSDYLLQGNGYFRMYLPPGNYVLNAESIDSSFYGGSGVGPYADTPTDVSFQSPHPIAPVIFGGATVHPVAISAGCVATLAFRLDGTGTLGGNCTPATPAPTTTTLATSLTPAPLGTSVTLTATVTGAAPTGSVAFTDGAQTIAGCGAIALTGSGNARTAACTTSTLTVGTHSIVAGYGGDPANATSSSAALSEVINAPAPLLLSAVSRKVHGTAGTFDLPLALTPGNPTTEPRNASTLNIVLTFNQPIASATLTLPEGVATSSGIVASGNGVIVSLVNVATGQYLTVALANVTGTGGATGGSGSVRLGLLVGDVNGSRTVTIADVIAVNASLSQRVTAANFLRDVNASGTISLTDKLTASANQARALPAP